MAERLDLFATPVLKVRPPQAEELNVPLLASIEAQRRKNAGIDRPNLGGWHSDTDMTAWGGKPAKTLADIAVSAVGPLMIDVARAGKREFNWVVEMWANVNRPGDGNQMHCHPAAYWSGVYYPDPGGAELEHGGGELLLEDPRYPLAYMTVPELLMKTADGEAMHSQVVVRPEKGLLVLFPSWLRHSVRPHRGDRNRVSIALNLSLSGVRPAADTP